MKTVAAIIEMFGCLGALARKYIRIENGGYMQLVIERLGEGPSGYPVVSVAHTYIQEGDVMYDPEMTFEVNWEYRDESDGWGPITYRQDNLGMHQTAQWRDANTGQVMIAPRLVRDLKSFARTWNKNLREQGFLTAARAVCNQEFVERAQLASDAAPRPEAPALKATPRTAAHTHLAQPSARASLPSGADIEWVDG